jgi:L-fuculose-phosphate aldolase
MNLKSADGEVARSVLDATKRLYERSLNTVLSGNISARVSADRALITPSALDKYRIAVEGRVEQLSLIDINSNTSSPLSGPKPSSEFRVHTHIYRLFPEINAVVHPHPQYSLAMISAMGSAAFIEALEKNSEEYGYYVGKVASNAWMPAGTAEIADRVAGAVKAGATVIVMEGHGTVAVGRTMQEALGRAESLESMAQKLFVAQQTELWKKTFR